MKLSLLVMTGRRVGKEWLNQPLFSNLILVAVSLAAWRIRELSLVYSGHLVGSYMPCFIKDKCNLSLNFFPYILSVLIFSQSITIVSSFGIFNFIAVSLNFACIGE